MALVPTLNPRNACLSEGLGKCCFKVERFPLMQGIQMFDELRQQTNAEAPN